MTDKPIIFSAPMIRALLDGRKTQTRRILKDVPEAPAMDNIAWPDKKLHPAPYLDAYCGGPRTSENPRGMTENWAYWTRDDRPGPLFKVGYVPGDRLWVREEWSGEYVFRNMGPAKRPHAIDCGHGDFRFRETVWHWADGSPDFGDWEKPRPSIHMPRWASRLTLVVTDVRVQRVQDISRKDCDAEGCPGWMDHDWQDGEMPEEEFSTLWDSINAKRGFGWDANPWVVALTFDVHKCNIDQMEAA